LLEAALGPAGETLFEIIVSGEDVTKKKPDPEAYLIALERLQLPPASCLAFEDSRNGLLAARAAGLRTVVTPSLYSAHEDFREATLVARHLDHGPEGTPLTVETLAALV
jgi:beta-phosphoglucomutase-like phosphatase (HAD superfamily)